MLIVSSRTNFASSIVSTREQVVHVKITFDARRTDWVFVIMLFSQIFEAPCRQVRGRRRAICDCSKFVGFDGGWFGMITPKNEDAFAKDEFFLIYRYILILSAAYTNRNVRNQS